MSREVRGVGVDTVEIGSFAATLAEPGTRFAGAFSGTERRQSRERAEARGVRAGDAGAPSARGSASSSSPAGAARDPAGTARHLAGRWAVKEAVIKAWSVALYGQPPPIPPDRLRWPEIETVCDAWGRPSIRLSGEVARQVSTTVGSSATWHVSLSHDGDAAVAFVVLEA